MSSLHQDGVTNLNDGNDTVEEKKKDDQEAQMKEMMPLKSMIPKKTIMLTNNFRFLEDFWVLEGSIGEPGTFGVAYRCHKKDNPDEKFVVKRMSKAKLYHLHSKDRVEQLAQISNEIETQKNLDHRNICKLFDVYEDRNYVNLIMEELNGGELFERIEQEDGFSEDSAAKIARQILDAVSFMHSKGICHFDLKPENILFASPDDNKIKVIDFGMAQVVPRLKKLKQLAGSAYYMAPEVLAGNYDREADVWSIGIIIFCMLFGYPPHYVDTDSIQIGESEEEAIYKSVKQGFDPTVKAGYGAWFPEDIPVSKNARDLLTKMLAFDEKDRCTAEEAFNHPWIREQNDVKALPRTMFRSLIKFQKTSRFKVLVSRMFAKKLDPQRYAETIEVFKKWDIDKDGEITLEEFRQGMKQTTKFSDDEIDRIFQSLDQDDNRSITLDELIISSAFDALVSADERLHSAFSDLDTDGDGLLSVEELRNALEKVDINHDLGRAESILAEIDNNNDKTIDYQEFLRALHPTLNELEASDMDRLKSRGFGTIDDKRFNKYVSETRKRQLIDGVINPASLLESLQSVAVSHTPRRRESGNSIGSDGGPGFGTYVLPKVFSQSERHLNLKSVAENIEEDISSSDEDETADNATLTNSQQSGDENETIAGEHDNNEKQSLIHDSKQQIQSNIAGKNKSNQQQTKSSREKISKDKKSSKNDNEYESGEKRSGCCIVM